MLYGHRQWPGQCSGPDQKSPLFNLISYQPNMDKIYFCAKDPYEAKYQLLTDKRETSGLNVFKWFKAFIEYSIGMNDIYKNIEECNPSKKHKILIIFDDMISDMLSNKKLV